MENAQREILAENEPSLFTSTQVTAGDMGRIMVVDDEESLREMLSETISIMGWIR
jgi:hypothetical protein